MEAWRRRRVASVRVTGIGWLGVGPDSVSRMRSFTIDVLGLRLVSADAEHFVELAMTDGARLELFSPPAAADSPWLFASNPVVAGFLVDDIEAARDELAQTADVELLGELHVMPDGHAWLHFRAPDGHVYGLTTGRTAGDAR
jgi:hypothetical protein